MVWPFSSSKKEQETDSSSGTTPLRTSERKPSSSAQSKPLLLEDTEPRFNNGPTPSSLPIKEAVSTISTESFKFSNLVKIPCFREAGLTGLSSLGVLGVIIFLTSKSPTKATNWAIGGFLLGSTVSWEQCRSKRRKELEFTKKAKETVALKEKPMMGNKNLDDGEIEHRKEVKRWWSRS